MRCLPYSFIIYLVALGGQSAEGLADTKNIFAD